MLRDIFLPPKSYAVIKRPTGTFRRKARRKPFFPRLHDFLVVHQHTFETRRFVDVLLDEVLNDLSGNAPAYAQAEFASFWGKGQRTGKREHAQNYI